MGDKDGALEAYTNLARGTPPDAPWQLSVRARIMALGGRIEAIEAVQNAMPAEQQAMIRGMVEQLAGHLEQDGSDAEGWLRLIRSYSVLRETDLAKAALTKARAALAQNADGLKRVNALADELGLKG
jgi:cytochrome c-type biogenesis protein CcmH